MEYTVRNGVLSASVISLFGATSGVELYDLTETPYEQVDFAKNKSEIALAMSDRLDE